jgi:two-component sensor histidine kinase
MLAVLEALWLKPLSLQSIRGRLALFLALAFLPAGIIAFQAGQASLTARDDAIQGERGAIVLRGLGQARDDIIQLRESVRTLAANADLFAYNDRECQQTLAGFAEEFGSSAVLTILDERAIVRCSNVSGAEGQRTAGDGLILEARFSGRVAVGYLPSPRLSDEPALAAVAEVADARGDPLFVGVTRPVGPILAAANADEIAAGGFSALLSRSGELLLGRGIEAGSADALAIASRFEGAPASLGAAFRVDDKWAVAMPLEGDLFIVEGWTPAPEGFAGVARAMWVLLTPLALWLAAVGATWIAIEHFVAQPLLVVESLARGYARGEDREADEALLRGAPSEIQRLRRTLAAMAKTLRGREARLAVALQEERALLLEVNHRVKNNLQMVASILSIQARSAVDAAEARGLARAQDRVQLLALSHAKIYGSGEVRDIAVDQLAAEVARALCSAREAGKVRLDLQLSPVRANADRAVPLAFLIGECVSSLLDLNNDGAQVESILIKLAPSEHGGFILEIDARAVSEGVLPVSPVSQRLVGAFARQLEAELSYDEARPCFVRIERRGDA